MAHVTSLLELRSRCRIAECWTFEGSTTAAGYGQVIVEGVKRYTHRLAYEFAHGSIPAGLVIDHLCRNRACCNPEHLEAVTRRTNNLRGGHQLAVLHRENRCRRGHDLAVHGEKNGPRRTCGTCRRARVAARRAVSS